jgi:Skp family chaperone for outer membrane proteins
MKTSMKIGAGIIASCAILLGAAAWAHTAGFLAAPTAVAIVDLDALQAGLQEQKDLGVMLQAKYKPMNDDLDQMTAEYEALVKKLKDEEPTMTEEEKRALNIKGLLLEQRMKNTDEIRRQALQVEIHAVMQEFYPKIYDAISRVAQRDGWDIVFLDTSKIDPSGMRDLASMNDAVARKHVLYVNENVDITDDVLTMLNNDYANRQAQPTPPAATPIP